MDRCLHPALTNKLIELFLSKAEQKNTQLIITCHESRLLASELLRNDEITFIVKDATGQSIINPLEKYQLRADKKVYAALFDGSFHSTSFIFDYIIASLLIGQIYSIYLILNRYFSFRHKICSLLSDKFLLFHLST